MDQLLLVYDDVSKWLDNGSIIDLIMFDFAKAFDVVSHPVLLAKLSLIGIDTHLIYWIEDFLVGRTMTVSVKGRVSSPHLVMSGVPQGSVLGPTPTPFLVFVNHIASTLTCRYKIFADDLKMYLKIGHDIPDHYASDSRVCQNDISTLQHTAASWCLTLNQKKMCGYQISEEISHLSSTSLLP